MTAPNQPDVPALIGHRGTSQSPLPHHTSNATDSNCFAKGDLLVNQILTDLYPFLLEYATARLETSTDAEDVVADVLLRVQRHWPVMRTHTRRAVVIFAKSQTRDAVARKQRVLQQALVGATMGESHGQPWLEAEATSVHRGNEEQPVPEITEPRQEFVESLRTLLLSPTMSQPDLPAGSHSRRSRHARPPSTA